MLVEAAGNLDRLLIVASVAIWLGLSYLVYERLPASRATRRALEVLVVLIAILTPLVPTLASREIALDRVALLERNLAATARAKLARAISSSNRPYEQKEIREIFIDRGRNYSKISIALYEVKYAGIASWDLQGETVGKEVGSISFPFGSNIPIPSEAEEFVQILNKTGNSEGVPVTPRVQEVWPHRDHSFTKLSFPDSLGSSITVERCVTRRHRRFIRKKRS